MKISNVNFRTKLISYCSEELIGLWIEIGLGVENEVKVDKHAKALAKKMSIKRVVTKDRVIEYDFICCHSWDLKKKGWFENVWIRKSLNALSYSLSILDGMVVGFRHSILLEEIDGYRIYLIETNEKLVAATKTDGAVFASFVFVRENL